MVSSSARAALPAQPGQAAGLPQHVRAHLRPAQRDGQPPRLRRGRPRSRPGRSGAAGSRPGAGARRTRSAGAARGRPAPAPRRPRPAAARPRPGRPQTARLKLFSVRPSSSGSPIRRAISTARSGGPHPAVVRPEGELDAEGAEQPGGQSRSSSAGRAPASRSSSRATMSSSTTPCGRQFQTVTLPQTAAACARHSPVVELAGHGDRLADDLPRPRSAARCAAGRCRAR